MSNYQVISIRVGTERMAIGHAYDEREAIRITENLRRDAEPTYEPCDCSNPSGRCAALNAAFEATIARV